MNRYRFILENYHAIKSARIDLDGITVMAGVNGCGKSTISRWLFAFVYFSTNFDRIIDLQVLETLRHDIRNYARAVNTVSETSYQIRIHRLFPLSIIDDEDFSYRKVLKSYESRIRDMATLIDRVYKEGNEFDINWLQNALKITDNLFGSPSETFIEIAMEKASKQIEEAKKRKKGKNFSQLLTLIKDDIDFYPDAPEFIDFIENGLSLISNGSFKVPLGLRNVVYVDTPMALSNFSDNNLLWSKLKDQLSFNSKSEPSEKAKSIIQFIQNLIGGTVEYKEDEVTSDAELRYVRESDKLNIPLNEAATGLKAFAYILQLLQNGNLDSQTLLIIDEPEAHLHPQWVVEFAYLLIRLKRELGVTILLASHNPDMIAAIQAISAAHYDKDTKFYLAEKSEDSLQFSYKYLGMDIEPIFASFNIAFERISQYESKIANLHK